MRFWGFSRSLSLAALLSLPSLVQGSVPNIESQAAAQQLDAGSGVPPSLVLSPSSQYVQVGTSEVVTALVTDGSAPLAGVPVDFFVVDQNAEGGGNPTASCGVSSSANPPSTGTIACAPDPSDAVTDANGLVSFTYGWKSPMGKRPLKGSLMQKVTATAQSGAGTISASTNITWVNSVTSVVLSASQITARYGAPMTLAAALTHTSDEGETSAVPYPGAKVGWRVYQGVTCTPGSATLPSGQAVLTGTALTDATGSATITYEFGVAPFPSSDTAQCLFAFYDTDGNGLLGSSDPATSATVTWSASASQSSQLTLTPGVSSIVVGSGESQTVTGKLTDQYGSGVANSEVTWQVAPEGGGPTESASATTGPDGQFSVTVGASNSAGKEVVSAAMGPLAASAIVYRVVPATSGSYSSASVLIAQADTETSGSVDVAIGSRYMRFAYDGNDIFKVGQTVAKLERFAEQLKPGTAISANPYRADPTQVSTFSVASTEGESGGGHGSGSGGSTTATVAGVPTNLGATGADGQVNLSWSAPAKMGTGTPYGYNVFMGTAPGTEDLSVSVTVVAGASYTVSGLTNGTKYYFVVQTVTSAGVSGVSNEANATPLRRSPTTTTSSPSGGSTQPVRPPAGPSTVVPRQVGTGTQGGSTGGSATGTASGAVAQGSSTGNLKFSASPTKSAGAAAVTYKVKVSGARGGTVLVQAGSRLVCAIQLDNQGQGQCTSSRWNGAGAVTATYLGSGSGKALSVNIKTSAVPASYWLVTANGSVPRSGGAPDFGSLTARHIRASNILGLVPGPDGHGYWMVSRDGGVFAFGSAHFYGSLAGKHLAGQIVGMAPTSDGHGYWTVGRDGGVFAFGSAHFYGSLGGKHLAGQIVGMAPTSDGHGYWLVGSDGAVSAFGSARSFGSLAGKVLASPVVGMAPTSDGHGYWLVGSDGAVSAFGSARSFGSLAGNVLASPVVGMAPTPNDQGYWLVSQDASVISFGNATSLATPPALTHNNSVVGIAPW
jgi:hypothetical protein